MTPDLVLAPWVAAEGDRIVADLLEWLRIPSISAQPDHAGDVRLTGEAGRSVLGRVLQAPVLYLGVAYPDDRFHAPNERLVMDQFWKGLLASAELWRELGATPGDRHG